MNSNYFIELAILHCVLIAIYWLFLRNEQQYSKLRYYLLGATIISLITPLLHLPQLFQSFFEEESVPVVLLQPIDLSGIAVYTNPTSRSFDYSFLLGPYLMISGVFIGIFGRNLYYLIRLYYQGENQNFENYKIILVKGIPGTYTFFNWVFVNPNLLHETEDLKGILTHERAHSKLGHTYDLIFLELFKAFFWWLPGAWYVNKEIKKIHEYQADSWALKSSNVDWYSSILIRSTLKSNGLSLASSFHDGLIFKRLKAMKQKAKKLSPWKIGVITVLSTLLIVTFACNEEIDAEIKKMGELNNAISFDQLPVNMQTSVKGVKDDLSFVKLEFSEKQTNEEIKEAMAKSEYIQSLDPNTIHYMEVDKEAKTFYLALKKDGAHFDHIAETSKTQDEVYTIVENQPEFPGGWEEFYKYIAQEISYPEEARKSKTQGRVYVQFVVDTDGSITEVKAVKGIGKGCDEEAERVIANSPKFNPGTQRGQNVKVRLVMPIIFKLDESVIDSNKNGVIVIEEVEQNNKSMKIKAEFSDDTWTGKVFDAESGNVLPGVNIIEAGTNQGTVSGIDGSFKLNLSDRDHKVILSFIGYNTEGLEVNQ